MPEGSGTAKLDIQRLDTNTSFRKEAYAVLKRAITAIDIYDHPGEVRLDERRLSEDLGVSRTPIREAVTLLEQEGFVRIPVERAMKLLENKLPARAAPPAEQAERSGGLVNAGESNSGRMFRKGAR